MKKTVILLIVMLWFWMPLNILASEVPPEAEIKKDAKQLQEDMQKKIWAEFEMDELDGVLKDIFPDEKIKFAEVMEGLMTGNLTFSAELIWNMISDQFFYEFRNSKTGMVHILLIIIIAAVFTNFSSVFQNQQISEMSFYVLYLLLITISLNAFRLLGTSASENLGHLVTFMKFLGPVYFLAVAFASGSGTSVMFYNLVLLLIFLVELLILNFLIPLVQVYIVMKILNYLSAEEYLSKCAELLETVIVWTLKTLLAAVVGLNVIQGLLSPAIDSLKRSAVTRGAEAIPVIGDALGGMTEVVLGTAVLIKNGIGVTGTVICIGICLVPMIQMAVVTLMYKLIAALIQPISDQRIVGCISSIADGAQILLRIVFTTGMLFLLTIVVVAAVAGI